MDLHPDFRDLLAEFARFGVSFAVLGGYAVGHHGKPRATKDLDLLVSGAGDNLRRVAEALRAFGAPAGLVASAAQLGPTEVVFLGVPPVRVDILRNVDGVDTEAVIARVVTVTIDGLSIPIIHSRRSHREQARLGASSGLRRRGGAGAHSRRRMRLGA